MQHADMTSWLGRIIDHASWQSLEHILVEVLGVFKDGSKQLKRKGFALHK